MWERKEVLVTVKAYPEHSKRHGDVVCTAGITKDGDFIRLYPINTGIYSGEEGIKKYDWIEVYCKKADEKLKRKESYKVLDGSIKIIDRSLSTYSSNKAPWDKRNEIILKKVSPSIKHLDNAFYEDRTSLGLIKVKELIDFYTEEELQPPPISKSFLKNLFDDTLIPIIDKIPHFFRYRFYCEGCKEEEACNINGKFHDIQCEDWELFQAYRNWWNKYQDIDKLWAKLYEKFYDNMKKKDLYFFMGTHSQYNTWLIIGLYYPTLESTKQYYENPRQKLDYWFGI